MNVNRVNRSTKLPTRKKLHQLPFHLIRSNYSLRSTSLFYSPHLTFTQRPHQDCVTFLKQYATFPRLCRYPDAIFDLTTKIILWIVQFALTGWCGKYCRCAPGQEMMVSEAYEGAVQFLLVQGHCIWRRYVITATARPLLVRDQPKVLAICSGMMN